MKGHQEIIDALQNLLNHEMYARAQYLVYARQYQDWGMTKLFTQMQHDLQEEQVHIDAIMDRMLFLEGSPELSQKLPPKIGSDVQSMLQNDLDAEVEVAGILRSTMKLCEELKDFETRDILQKLLHDTEMDHIYTLEQQLGLIEKIGVENYLQSQI